MSSKTEVEARFRVKDRAALIRKLRAIGAQALKTSRITDFGFSMPGRDAWQSVESIRVRKVRGERGGTFSYKPSGMKVQRTTAVKEYETRVDDPDALVAAFLAMGIKPRKHLYTISKTRSSFGLGRATIDIDDFGKAGCYAEIEVMTQGGVASASAVIESVAERLGFSEGDRINMSIGFILRDLVLAGKLHPVDLN